MPSSPTDVASKLRCRCGVGPFRRRRRPSASNATARMRFLRRSRHRGCAVCSASTRATCRSSSSRASVVSLVIKQWSTAIVLFVLSLINAVTGLRQEGKAESAMNALKSMMEATARVRRDGVEAEIPAEQLVVGDVVLIAAGDEVPADGRIVSSSSLQIDESALTGESVPAGKDADTLPEGDLGAGDQDKHGVHAHPSHPRQWRHDRDQCRRPTPRSGKIAGMLSATATEETPLTKQMNTLTLWIVGAAGITMIIMFALGIYRGQSWMMLFNTAVALAIAAIPLALPMVVQVVLSLGSVELAKQKAIVKDLPSVETLGFTSAINSDKTGTLTMNQMTAVEVLDPTDRYTITGSGYSLEGKISHPAGKTDTLDAAILPYVIANDAKLVDGKVVGDPTEGALLVLAYKAGMDIEADPGRTPAAGDTAVRSHLQTDGHLQPHHRPIRPAGRPLLRQGRRARGHGPGHHSPRRRHQHPVERRPQDSAPKRTSPGWAKPAFASWPPRSATLTPTHFDPDGDLLGHIHDLEMTSLVAMVDPPREESKAAVANAQHAHIRVRMVTGDDVVTGAAIAKQLGIDGEAMLGADFAALSDQERHDRIDSIGVVGRVAPEHKVLLAQTLKDKGDVVAMTGDGVNDAPAIKAADIGIAMGSGTEVAKNAGRMILSDDNFATIVYAVEQGRKLYDNLNKFIRFVLLELVAFVLTFLGATLLNLAAGQPFTPAQILWINFLVNAPFGVALGFDEETPGLMARRPRPRGESILTKPMMITCGLGGLYVAVANLLLIFIGKNYFGSIQVGQSIGLVAFSLMLVVAAFESRHEKGSVFNPETFNSPRMNKTALIEIALAYLITQADFLNKLLGTVSLTFPQWGLALLAAVLLLFLWELGKLIARRSGTAERAAAH